MIVLETALPAKFAETIVEAHRPASRRAPALAAGRCRAIEALPQAASRC